jgi:transcriptional regulator with XRE-family HTH domain
MAQTLLAELRIKKELIQETVANEANIDIERYKDLEAGLASLKYEEAGSLGQILGINPIHLLETAKTINYNIGAYARTIYAEKYYEEEEKER